jgi:hypothetical protein
MKNIIIAASVAAFAFAAPAYAGPGKGQNNQVHKMGKAHKSGDFGQIGHAGHRQGGAGGCPPGLAKKPMCMPPGQYKQRFGVGERIPNGYDGLLGYNALPYGVRSQYGAALDPRSNYIYDRSYLYRVDPTTMLVQQVLGALVR